MVELSRTVCRCQTQGNRTLLVLYCTSVVHSLVDIHCNSSYTGKTGLRRLQGALGEKEALLPRISQRRQDEPNLLCVHKKGNKRLRDHKSPT